MPMDVRSTDDNPFLETRTAIMIRDIRDGYILYSYCDYERGEWMVRNKNHSMEYEDVLMTYSHVIKRGGSVK